LETEKGVPVNTGTRCLALARWSVEAAARKSGIGYG
jgi:hypothetical protein